MQVKVSSSPAASSVAPDGVMPSQPVSLRAPNLSVHVAGVLDDDLVFDGLADFAGLFGGAVGAFAFDPLLLFDREGRFGGDFGGDFVGGLGAGAFVAFDRGFVGVGADRQSLWLQVKDSSAPAASSVAPDGAMPSQPVSFRAPNLIVHVAGVLDDDLVFDRLADFAGLFAGAVGAFAVDPLLLFDREGRFGGDFGRWLCWTSWCRCLRCLRSRLRWCRSRPRRVCGCR